MPSTEIIALIVALICCIALLIRKCMKDLAEYGPEKPTLEDINKRLAQIERDKAIEYTNKTSLTSRSETVVLRGYGGAPYPYQYGKEDEQSLFLNDRQVRGIVEKAIKDAFGLSCRIETFANKSHEIHVNIYGSTEPLTFTAPEPEDRRNSPHHK
jgi:hypothetical protein